MNSKHILALLVMISCFVSYASAQENNVETTDTLSSFYDELDELVITARKDLVKSDGAKLTYSVEDDDSSKGQSVLDALRKVPMVTVDGQDNIYIRGSQNFKIYVNGKEEPMLSANAATILKAMPSDALSKIEVITEPGAKYDAEGVGGILNLVTERKQSKDGYTGSASINYSSQNIGASLYGRMKYDKVTADASVNYSNNNLQKQTMINETELLDYDNYDYYRTIDRMRQAFTFNYLGANLNLSWEPSAKDLFTFGGNITDIEAGVKNLTDNRFVYDKDGNLRSSTLQKIKGGMQNLSAAGNAGYRRLFSDKGNSLTLAYRFNYGYNPWNLDYENSSELGSPVPFKYQKNEYRTYQREHTVTADYVNPFADGMHTIETGVKGIFRRNNLTSKSFAGAESTAMLPIDNNEGFTRQLQEIYAVYASYTGKAGNFSFTGGLRYEHTRMGLAFPLGNAAGFSRHLNDIVPNAAVTYMFGPATNLRLAYQMRINRPTINQLDPAEFRVTQTMVQVGNPNLNSEHYNNLSLTYSNFGRVLGGNIAFNYNQSNNTIESYTYFKDGVSYSTYGNFGKNRKAELAGFINWNITSAMSLSLNASVDFTSIKSGDGMFKNHGWNGNYGANYSYTGPWKVKYSLYGGQSTGRVRLQGKFSGWHYYGLGFSKALLKDESLTVAINASNFFTKYLTFRTDVVTPTNYSVTRGKTRSWNVGVSLTWKFGHLQEQVKKTGANLENNDSKSIESQGGLGF